jgi:hypothetical protein
VKPPTRAAAAPFRPPLLATSLATSLAALLVTGACRTPPPVAFEGPVQVEGLEVAVETVYRAGRSGPILAVVGSARNVGPVDLEWVRVFFELLDAQGVKVGDADAETPGLWVDQVWRFDAEARVKYRAQVTRVRVGRVELAPASGP